MLFNVTAEAGDGCGQLITTTGFISGPKRNVGWLTVSIFNQHPALLNFQYAVTGITQLKDISGHAFKGKIFVQCSDPVALWQHDHFIIEMIGDGATVLQRCQPGSGPATQLTVDSIIKQQCRTPSPAG